METLKLEIVTPIGLLFNDEVKMLTVPGKEGEFGILPKHASLLTLLKEGVIEYEMVDGSMGLIAIDGGNVNIQETGVSILADNAVAISGTSDEVKAKIKEAEELIASISSDAATIAGAKSKLESAAKGLL